MLGTDLLFFFLSCFFLFFAGYALVRTSSIIASFLHMSEFVAGFIIIAIGTSIPELFVGITSALAKNPQLSLGNVIGANIADLTIVMGLSILLAKGIKIKSKKTILDSIWMVIFAALPMVLMIIGNRLSRMDGMILIVAFSIYGYQMIKERKEFHKPLKNKVSHVTIVLSSTIFILSLFIMFMAAQMVVRYSTALSMDLGFSTMLIGLILLSFGTTLPETVFNAHAIFTGYTQMAVGDIIGSVIANSTLVLGIAAMIYPITADMILVITSGSFMILAAFLFVTFIESGKRLSWKEGISMVMLYTVFLIFQFYINVLAH